ncbi:hypothetical protein [Methylovirgula sp. 4M-Z18]|uniref:hypothetical protein n=1 Tax=Methylovirgula sp. 4M-Z18 TaxID=2293567 RepID=UPI000E2EB472|nr:hypothetical protein [Methylovirgula sp. 4M-Z18]RFB78323.1 hypothetical protein DYH55_16365 [Methylovirgula sp. 4M-Z18]
MDAWFTVAIPTRDSAGWIGPLLDHYLARGVTPTLFLDSRTRDKTREIALRAGVPIVDIAPFTFVESIVRVTRDVVRTPWALFVNDDEILSDCLFERLRGPEPPAEAQSVAIPRRWAWYEPGRPLSYARTSIWLDRAGRNGADHHWRLFRPNEVTFVAKMHSDGFLIDRWSRMRPEAYIAHFEWVLRTRAQRAAKLRRYDRYRHGYGSFFANMYLPEDQPPGAIDFTPFETDAYDLLARTYYTCRGAAPADESKTLRERIEPIRRAAEQMLGLVDLRREPKDRAGLTPRLDAEIVDPFQIRAVGPNPE